MDYTLLMTEASKIFAGAVLGTLVTTWYKNKNDKRKERKELFVRLVAAKGYMRLPQRVIDDINMIEIIFRGEKKVIEKYRTYYADLCTPVEQINHDKTAADLWDLLREMGNCVGYKNLDNNTLHQGYLPTGSLNEHTFQMDFQKAVIPFLKSMAFWAESGKDLNPLLIEFYENFPYPPPPASPPEQKPDEPIKPE